MIVDINNFLMFFIRLCLFENLYIYFYLIFMFFLIMQGKTYELGSLG